MNKKQIAAGIVAGAAACLGMAGTAQAAVPSVPLTCGMQVFKDTNIYMTKNLNCTTRFGVQVDYDNGSDNATVPHVTIDMRGHTLSGTGSPQYSLGITNPESDVSGTSYLTVRNGAITGFYYGLGTGQHGNADHMRLVANKVGMLCNETCKLTDSVVERNTVVGTAAGGESNLTVSRTVFYGNAQAASVGGINSLQIDHSTFLSNKVGIYNVGARPVISDSMFTGNDVVDVNADPDFPGCITLTRDPLIGNRVTWQGANVC